MEQKPDFRNASTSFLRLHKFIWDGARKMSRERSGGQPGTIEIGPVEPRELNAPGSHDGFAGGQSARASRVFAFALHIFANA